MRPAVLPIDDSRIHRSREGLWGNYALAAMQRIVSILVVFGMAVAACSGADTDAPASGESGTVSLDLSGHTPLPVEQALAALETSLQEAFVAELAENGVTLSIEDLAAHVDLMVTAVEEEVARSQEEIAGITGASVLSEEASAGATTGVRLLAPPPGAALSAVSATTDDTDVATQFHYASIFVGLLSGGMLGLHHDGPGDYGPKTIDLGKNPFLDGPASMTVTKQGSKITLLINVFLGPKPPADTGVRFEWRVVIDACPDDAGEATVEFTTLTEYVYEKDGKRISGELRMDGTGVGNVGDDATIIGYNLDLTGSRATRTTKDGKIQPGASFVEIALAQGHEPEGRFSSDATVKEVEALISNMQTTIDGTFTVILAFMQDGWSNGQCIELEVDMPSSVGIGSETTAKVKVNHRYEEKVLQLPITGELTVGGESIDPAEATGDPAEFTYTAPDKANETATLTFEVTSKRGADKKAVDVATESMAVDVAFSGTISYSMTGFSLNGVVTIPSVTLLEYGGDDPELKGKWTGQGAVQISLTSQIEGCGTATGTQEGGQVTVVGTPYDENGTLMLSLFAEDMEGGEATMTCGTGGATVAGQGLSIGAGLINLGKVVIPAEPGTYPFESTGVAAGMVQYTVKGEAVVTESEDFPG